MYTIVASLRFKQKSRTRHRSLKAVLSISKKRFKNLKKKWNSSMMIKSLKISIGQEKPKEKLWKGWSKSIHNLNSSEKLSSLKILDFSTWICLDTLLRVGRTKKILYLLSFIMRAEKVSQRFYSKTSKLIISILTLRSLFMLMKTSLVFVSISFLLGKRIGMISKAFVLVGTGWQLLTANKLDYMISMEICSET